MHCSKDMALENILQKKQTVDTSQLCLVKTAHQVIGQANKTSVGGFLFSLSTSGPESRVSIFK